MTQTIWLTAITDTGLPLNGKEETVKRYAARWNYELTEVYRGEDHKAALNAFNELCDDQKMTVTS